MLPLPIKSSELISPSPNTDDSYIDLGVLPRSLVNSDDDRYINLNDIYDIIAEGFLARQRILSNYSNQQFEFFVAIDDPDWTYTPRGRAMVMEV